MSAYDSHMRMVAVGISQLYGIPLAVVLERLGVRSMTAKMGQP